MIIKFIVGNPAMNVVNDWDEILEWNKSGLASYSYEEYSKIKGLEIIGDFENEINKSRKKLNILEEGLDYSKVVKILNEFVILNDDEKSLLKKIKIEEQRINDIFILDDFIKKQIKSLIIGNFVFPNKYHSNPDGSINYEIIRSEERDKNEETSVEEVSINITSPIKKNTLIKFIDTVWNKLELSISNLPTKNTLSLREIALQTVKLKDNTNLTFGKIAEKIIKDNNIDDPEGKVNQDSIKTKYHVTKEKLDTIAKLKVTK